MSTKREDIEFLEELIYDAEKDALNGELTLNQVDDLFNQLNSLDINDENLRAVLKNKLLGLKRKITGLTKWDIFVEDIMQLEGFSDLKSLVKDIDAVKNDVISEEQISAFDKRRVALLTKINEQFNNFEADRIENEINKKIKLFKNRNIRAIDNNFGEYLRNLRLKKGLSLDKLQEISGVTASYVFRLEHGTKKAPSIPIAKNLAKALGVPKTVFLSKLGILDNEEADENYNLNDLLIVKNFKINDKEIDIKTKDTLLNLISFVTQLKLDENNSLNVADGLTLIKNAEIFLRELNK